MYYDINKEIYCLKESGLFTMEQIRVINYAIFIPEIDVKIIINPFISSEYMTIYVELMKCGINVRPFINEEYHLTEDGQRKLLTLYERVKKSKNENLLGNQTNKKMIRRN